jgi:L-fuconolactonase
MKSIQPNNNFVPADLNMSKKIPLLLLFSMIAISANGYGEEGNGPIPVIDTHIHLYDLDRLPGLPWPEKDDKFLYKSMLSNDYNKVIAENNLAGVIVVEASPRVSDNDWVLHHTQKYQNKYLGLIGALEFDKKTFKDDLERLCVNERFLGLRIGTQSLDQPLNKDYLKDPVVLNNLQLLSDAGKALDVLIFKLNLDDVIFMAKKYPKLKIVINHLGSVKIDGKDPDVEWQNKMKESASYPNVYCKVSSVMQQCSDKPASTDANYYKNVLENVFSVFGEDRIIYGSNWPCTIRDGDFSGQLKVVRDFFTPKGRTVLEKLFYKNAQKVYGFKMK